MNLKITILLFSILSIIFFSGAVFAQTASPTQRTFDGPMYDPHMDNHLKTPPIGSEVGLFGHPIREVEDHLRFLGAKNHSYAFGKHSRMVISVYLVTLSFDKERRLGGVLVEPRPPYKVIGPEARKFFLDVFVGEGGLKVMNEISMQLSSGRLELKYSGRNN